jgi:hypothetical protein
MFSKIAQIVKPVFMADGSMRLIIEVGEPTPEEVAEVCRLKSEGNLIVILAPEADMQAITTQ